ncbi:MAG: DUF1330 domain-containing protein [Butyricicoccus sp.]
MVYFIVSVFENPGQGRGSYEDYIRLVKPIVERHGGTYLVRSDHVVPLSDAWTPSRVIVIRFETREQLDRCFGSEEYRAITGKRENAVDARAVIVEEEAP